MTTFREFINEQDDPYQAFLKMRQGLGWGDLKQAPRGTTPTPGADVETPPPTRTGTRNPLEIKLSNEVQTGHKMGGVVSRAVLQRAMASNKGSLSGLVAPDRLKAQQAYPFIQKRQMGKDVPGVVEYNSMFPLHSLLRMLNIH